MTTAIPRFRDGAGPSGGGRGPTDLRRLPAVLATVALAPVLLCACRGTDTAGMAELPRWSAEQEVRIGSVDDPEYALTYFRQMSVGADGRMYTLHPMDQNVRVFHPDGTSDRTIGGRGDGPGEFQNAFGMGWIADTLWVLDGRGYRFSSFSPDGEFLSSFTVPFRTDTVRGSIQPPRARGLLFDGTLHGASPAFSSQIQEGTLTVDYPVLMTRDGGVTDSLPGTPFGRNQWAISDPDNPRAGGLYTRQPYADGPVWQYAKGERALIVLEREAPSEPASAAFRVTKLSFEGDTVFSRDYPFAPTPIDAQEVDSILDEMGSSLAERGILGVASATQGRDWAELSLYRPEFRSGVAEMVLAEDGGIWLSRGPDGSGATEWLVLDASGEPSARARLPTGLTVMVVDPPYVWGSETDELDVPYIVRYRLTQ